MDEYTGKQVGSGNVIPRRGSSLVLRESRDDRDQNVRFCNRIRCSDRLNHIQGAPIGCSEKAKSSRPSFRSSGKEIIGSSSRSCSVVPNARKAFQVFPRKLASHVETDSSETSSVQDEPEVEELLSSPRSVQTESESELRDAESSKAASMEVGSSSTATNTRARMMYCPKFGLTNQHNLGSPASFASKGSGPGVKISGNASRSGLRSLRCNSISDIVSQGCSSSESNIPRRRDMAKKRNPEGESSSSVRGKKMSGALSESGRFSLSTGGISISDSRRARNWPPNKETRVASVRTHRSMHGNNKTGLSNQVHGNDSIQTESSSMISQVLQPEIPINMNASSSHQFSSKPSSSQSSSYGHSGSSDDNLPSMLPMNSSELGIAHLINRDGLWRYNLDGIAEVLFALERIEQDEELSYEQLIALESNLFLGGLQLYDHHRDMRLDIDNMSYEELLALGEKIGTVSTALSEEALSKCLKRRIYQSPPQEGAMGCSEDGDDIKCSICQEEYKVGEEIGKLGCNHEYHVVCIHEWLQLKNWCPICKASAAPPKSCLDL